jgi:Domain of unknown function (DUF6438)
VSRRSLIIIVSAAICSAAQARSSDISSIKVEHTACFGTCPIYSLTIFRDGRVRYEGEGFVKEKGVRTKTISAGEFKRLAAKVDEIGFFKLKPAYRANITDLPTTIVTVVRGTESKRVEDYFGAPKRLHGLEEFIENVANISRWVKLDDKAAGEEFERAIRQR